MPQLGQPSQRAPAGNAHFRPHYGTENSKLNERSLELGTREQKSYRPVRLNQAQRNRLLPSKEQLAPDSSLKRACPALGLWETIPHFPGAFRRTRVSLDILVHSPLSFQRKSLCLLKTLFYLLQLQIHGSRHLASLLRLRSGRRPERGWGKGAPWRFDFPPSLLRLRMSLAARFSSILQRWQPPKYPGFRFRVHLPHVTYRPALFLHILPNTAQRADFVYGFKHFDK